MAGECKTIALSPWGSPWGVVSEEQERWNGLGDFWVKVSNISVALPWVNYIGRYCKVNKQALTQAVDPFLVPTNTLMSCSGAIDDLAPASWQNLVETLSCMQ